jgi:hypothetical protein
MDFAPWIIVTWNALRRFCFFSFRQPFSKGCGFLGLYGYYLPS